MINNFVAFRNGELLAKSGSVKLFNFNNELYLEDVANDLIISGSKKNDYVWQLGAKPFGKCLILGLGLGNSYCYIKSLPKIESITLVEQNKDIITVNNDIKYGMYNVINEDYLHFLFKSEEKYDFIFIDCYYKVNIVTLPFIADLVVPCKKMLSTNGILIGWLDNNTPEIIIDAFYNLFNVD